MNGSSRAFGGLDLDERVNDVDFVEGPSGLDLEGGSSSKGRRGLILKKDLTKNEESFLDPSGFAWELWSFKVLGEFSSNLRVERCICELVCDLVI